MFTDGFEKTANKISDAVGTVGGKAYSAVGAVAGLRKKFNNEVSAGLARAKKSRINAFHVQTGAGKKSIGEGLAKRRMKKLPKGTVADAESAKNVAKGEVLARLDRKRKSGPSFAARHPLKTAVGAFVAGRYAFGGSSPSQPQRQPEVQQPYY